MDTNEFKEKVLSLSERVYSMVARMLGNRANAEDAVQEIMIKLWDHRKQIGKHPNIPGFVFLTARNHCMDMLKKKVPEMDSDDFQLNILETTVWQNEMEWKELTVIIENLLKKLPEQQRQIMMMRDIDGLDFVEIAAVTELKLEYVRVLLSRARKKIGIQLKSIYSYE